MKILLHLLAAIVIVDILWIAIIMPYWCSTPAGKNVYWESLSSIHTFGITMAFLELVLKLGIGFLIFSEHKKSFPNDTSDLYHLSYVQAISK